MTSSEDLSTPSHWDYMAKSFEITKVSIRERLVVDEGGHEGPQDYDFSPEQTSQAPL